MVRAPCCEKVGLRQGTWTPEEDQRLKAYIQKHGHGNWRALPAKAGLSRCGKSCRLRWVNYLRPDIKRGNYSREEEEAIISLHQLLGNRWSAIAAKLPGRTDNEIKNYWHTYLKKHLNKYPLEPKTTHKRGNSVKEPQQLKLKNPHQDFTRDACADSFFLGERDDNSMRNDCLKSLCTPVEFSENSALESSTLDGYDMIADLLGTVVDSEHQFWVSCFDANQEQIEIPNDTKEFWFNILKESGESLEI